MSLPQGMCLAQGVANKCLLEWDQHSLQNSCFGAKWGEGSPWHPSTQFPPFVPPIPSIHCSCPSSFQTCPHHTKPSSIFFSLHCSSLPLPLPDLPSFTTPHFLLPSPAPAQHHYPSHPPSALLSLHPSLSHLFISSHSPPTPSLHPTPSALQCVLGGFSHPFLEYHPLL